MLFGRYSQFLQEKRDALVRRAETLPDEPCVIMTRALAAEFDCLLAELDRMEADVLQTVASGVGARVGPNQWGQQGVPSGWPWPPGPPKPPPAEQNDFSPRATCGPDARRYLPSGDVCGRQGFDPSAAGS